MKQYRLNMSDSSQMRWNGITKLRKVAVCSVIGLAGLFIGCSDDDVNPNNNEDEKTENGKISLQLLSGASQQGRIETLFGTRAGEDEGLRKKDKLTWVADIDAPAKATEYKWSTTAIAFSKDGKKAYITWHSDRQATDKATKWGGTVDVINIEDQTKPEFLGTAISDSMKFNHVFVGDANLFLAATHARTSGAIARVPLNNGEVTSSDADYIGFPGVSVNAVAPYNGELIAVSGHSVGTYATFAQDVKAGPYYYGPNAGKMETQQTNIKIHGVASNLSEEALEAALSDFGGKYVTADESGNTYVLYNKKGENAKIVNVATEKTVTLNTTLKSADKYAETYDFNTGTWIMAGEKVDFYGKHVFAVKGDYAYVACGQNGLRVFNINTGSETDSDASETEGNKTHTTGVCIDGKYLYTVGGAGLRIYEIKEGGKLLLCAYEMDTYSHEQADGGKATSNKSATTGNDKRHSPNFVAVNGEYVYVAHGQTGCTVYKFTPEAPSTTPAE